MSTFLLDEPRCLQGLKVQRLANLSESPDQAIPAEVEGIVFLIRCKGCDGLPFRFNEILLGSSLIGIQICCLECDRVDTIFNGLEHGYDGELGNIDHLDGGGERSTRPLLWHDGTLATTDRMTAVFTFNGDLDELQEVAEAAGVRPVDLFDWFELADDPDLQRPTIGAYQTIWDYECA